MRINNGVMVDNMMRNLQKNLKRLDKYNQQLSSGKKFQNPSQDPIGASTSMSLNSVLEGNDQFSSNVDQAKTWLSNTESALDNAGNILQRARDLAVYGSNGSLTGEDRQSIQKEAEELKKELVVVSNTKLGDEYLFSGQKTDQKAYILDTATNKYVFNGDHNSINRQIGPGITMKVNINGQEVFGKAIDALDNLVTDLKNNNTDGIENGISNIDKAINTNIKSRATIGAKINRLDLTSNRLDDEKLQTKDLLSKNEDVDIAEVITNLKMQESVYRASLSTGARVMQPTLVDFLQ